MLAKAAPAEMRLMHMTPLKTLECQRVLLGPKDDFETDPHASDEFETSGLDFLVIEPYAQTEHRVRVAHFARLCDKHCVGGNGRKRQHGNLASRGTRVRSPLADKKSPGMKPGQVTPLRCFGAELPDNR